MVNDPTLLAKDTPVTLIISTDPVVIEPTEEANSTPVIPTTSAGVIAPTPEPIV